MKKLSVLLIAFVVVTAFTVVSFAQETATATGTGTATATPKHHHGNKRGKHHPKSKDAVKSADNVSTGTTAPVAK